MSTITRRLEFDYGHRVLGHEGKCRHLHGHRGAAEITVSAADLDPIGRVIDFSVIKSIVGGWIDEHWDHNMLLHPDDPLATIWSQVYSKGSAGRIEMFGDKEPYIMKCGNPTAENIASELIEKAQELLDTQCADQHLLITRVRVYETPNCWADAFTKVGQVEKPRPRTMFG